ncbi:hypothetical protein SK355_09795 [Candidatus Fukatsuia symbiotica]|nr:hypothetical protein [Candidatus Fukatsuia symbiotica]MEA9445506.1 hypothetical protein [Candidatus Fukatsuia symbiotica]
MARTKRLPDTPQQAQPRRIAVMAIRQRSSFSSTVNYLSNLN